MARRYIVSASFTFTSAGGDCDLLELTAADDKPIRLRKLRLSQTSEVGDAQEENIRLQIIRMTATVTAGSGGATPNVNSVKQAIDSLTAGFTAKVNNTTLATTTGNTRTLEELGWNERNTPYEMEWPDEEDQYDAVQTQYLLLRAPAGPADDITMELTAEVIEEG